VRQLQVVGEDPKKYINGYTNDFLRDFISLLRTAHGEKWISANKFYNEYIRDKEHVHMNATRFASLTELTKHLGREGVCHVKEDEKDGLMIAWRDTSAAALKRKQEISEQEAAEARSGAGEDKILKKMAKRAHEEAEAKKVIEAKRAAAIPAMATPPPIEEPAPIKLSFGLKVKAVPPTGLGQMKSQSIFKRKKDDAGEVKPGKKVKL
jgi:DNA/RNA-binding protein KIN17